MTIGRSFFGGHFYEVFSREEPKGGGFMRSPIVERKGRLGSFRVFRDHIEVVVEGVRYDTFHLLKRRGGLLLAKRLVGLL